MSASPLERQEERQSWSTAPEDARGAEARGRASSVPQAASLPFDSPRVAVTDSDDYRRRSGLITALAEGRHVTGHLPSLGAARERHHEAAGQWDSPVLHSGRLAWGYAVHLPAKSVLMFIEWVLETPLRFLAVIILAAVTYVFVIRG